MFSALYFNKQVNSCLGFFSCEQSAEEQAKNFVKQLESAIADRDNQRIENLKKAFENKFPVVQEMIRKNVLNNIEASIVTVKLTFKNNRLEAGKIYNFRISQLKNFYNEVSPPEKKIELTPKFAE